MKPVVFLPGAEREMIEATMYYESQAPGLGVDYLWELENSVQAISESPNTWPIVEGSLEDVLSAGFPSASYTESNPMKLL